MTSLSGLGVFTDFSLRQIFAHLFPMLRGLGVTASLGSLSAYLRIDGRTVTIVTLYVARFILYFNG
jgi:hypothetical protein